jgi:CRISPR-associated protein Cas2
MADRAMLMVYCYDVVSDRVRARVAAALEETAVRVQKSVFEARLGRAEANALFNHVARLLDEGDSLRMYAVSRPGLERSRTEGGAPIAEDGDFWII